MIDYYGHPRCSTSKKAVNELDSRGISYQFYDLTQETPAPILLEKWMKSGAWPIKSFFNTSGNAYRELGLKDKVASLTIPEAAQLLSSNGMLIKRPLLVQNGELLQIGYRKPYADLDLEE